MNSPKDLSELIADLSEKLTRLETFVDTNDAQIRDSLADVNLQVSNLKTMIYGNENLRLKGQTDRIEYLESTVRDIVDARKSERDRLKGIQIGLGLTAFTGLSTLLTVISQIWQ